MNNDINFLTTIAIPTYCRREYALVALSSVLDQNVAFSFEVLVLDNEGDHLLETAVSEQSAISSIPLRYIHVKELGLHNGRNTAALEGKGEIIVYIDDDVIAPQGWLHELCQPFYDKNVGGVAGKVIPQWEVPPPDWVKILHPSYFSLLDEGDDIQEMKQPNTPYGCNMAYRRSIILELGGFPPDGVGGSKIEWHRGDGETGFAKKVYEHGYQIIYTGKAWLFHRIPPKRQTINFARHRTIKGAVSGAYSIARQIHLSRLRLLWQATKHIIKATIAFLKWLLFIGQPLHKRLPVELQLLHHAITTLYFLRAIIDPDLRQWIIRTDYWPI